ncbi:hypothetical protein ACWDX6_23825 [Streptomyces sp. NPDC003027]
MHKSVDSSRKDNAFVVFAGESGWTAESVYVGSNVTSGMPEPLTPEHARAFADALLRAADEAEASQQIVPSTYGELKEGDIITEGGLRFTVHRVARRVDSYGDDSIDVTISSTRDPDAKVIRPEHPSTRVTIVARRGYVTLHEPEPEPVYWFCNGCGDEVQDETAECCDDGEIEPSYGEENQCPTPGPLK